MIRSSEYNLVTSGSSLLNGMLPSFMLAGTPYCTAVAEWWRSATTLRPVIPIAFPQSFLSPLNPSIPKSGKGALMFVAALNDLRPPESLCEACNCSGSAAPKPRGYLLQNVHLHKKGGGVGSRTF